MEQILNTAEKATLFAARNLATGDSLGLIERRKNTDLQIYNLVRAVDRMLIDPLISGSDFVPVDGTEAWVRNTAVGIAVATDGDTGGQPLTSLSMFWKRINTDVTAVVNVMQTGHGPDPTIQHLANVARYLIYFARDFHMKTRGTPKLDSNNENDAKQATNRQQSLEQSFDRSALFSAYISRIMVAIRSAIRILLYVYLEWFRKNSPPDEAPVTTPEIVLQNAAHLQLSRVGELVVAASKYHNLETLYATYSGAAHRIKRADDVAVAVATAAGKLEFHIIFAQFMHYLLTHATMRPEKSYLILRVLILEEFSAMSAAMASQPGDSGPTSIIDDAALPRAMMFLEMALTEDASYFLRLTGLAGPILKEGKLYGGAQGYSEMTPKLLKMRTWQSIRVALKRAAVFAKTPEILQSLSAFSRVMHWHAATGFQQEANDRPEMKEISAAVFSKETIVGERVGLWRMSGAVFDFPGLPVKEMVESCARCVLIPLVQSRKHRAALINDNSGLAADATVAVLFQIAMLMSLGSDGGGGGGGGDGGVAITKTNTLLVRLKRPTPPPQAAADGASFLTNMSRFYDDYPEQLRRKIRSATSLQTLWELGETLLNFIFDFRDVDVDATAGRVPRPFVNMLVDFITVAAHTFTNDDNYITRGAAAAAADNSEGYFEMKKDMAVRMTSTEPSLTHMLNQLNAIRTILLKRLEKNSEYRAIVLDIRETRVILDLFITKWAALLSEAPTSTPAGRAASRAHHIEVLTLHEELVEAERVLGTMLDTVLVDVTFFHDEVLRLYGRVQTQLTIFVTIFLDTEYRGPAPSHRERYVLDRVPELRQLPSPSPPPPSRASHHRASLHYPYNELF
jgi:hypothetical protein